jgi:8-oxo-dGTP diphosphatase
MTQPPDIQKPRIGVGVIILRDKKVLLGLRKGHRSPGYYGLPGGYLEKNENFEDCAKREVLEETGLEGMSLRPIYLISGSSDNIHYADIIFYASYKDGEPTVRETDRAEKWEWFNIFDLPFPLYKPTELALSRFTSNFCFHKLNLFIQQWFPSKRVTILYVDSMNTEEIQSK